MELSSVLSLFLYDIMLLLSTVEDGSGEVPKALEVLPLGGSP
jgi:hypothetical protein